MMKKMIVLLMFVLSVLSCEKKESKTPEVKVKANSGNMKIEVSDGVEIKGAGGKLLMKNKNMKFDLKKAKMNLVKDSELLLEKNRVQVGDLKLKLNAEDLKNKDSKEKNAEKKEVKK